MEITVEEEADPADVQALRDGLDAFNRRHAPADGYRPLNLFLRGEDGAVLGGLLGETFWDWLHISILWVDEAHRGKGAGGRLLRQAEDEARRRGCVGVFVDTLSFQAPDFYARRGYAPWGRIEGLPPGHRRVFFQKSLRPE